MPTIEEQAQQFAEKFRKKYKEMPDGSEYALRDYYMGAYQLLTGRAKGEAALDSFDKMSGAVESLQRHMPGVNNAMLRGLLKGPAIEVFNENISYASVVAR